MGMPSCLDPRYRLAIPDTPPELVSPDSASISSSRYYCEDRDRDRDRAWYHPAAVPISPPMSNYDPTTSRADSASRRSPDEVQPRRDVGLGLSSSGGVSVGSGRVNSQSIPRSQPQQPQPQQGQQLPSLSSLFGPSQGRPLQSPLSDRPGSYASTASPQDRPFGSASSLERTFSSSSSYFPSTASSSISSAPRSALEPRLDDRSHFSSLSKSLPAPISPRSREPDLRRERPDSRSDISGGSRWPIHDGARGEYSLGSGREPAYKSPQDRLPPTLSILKREDDMAGPYLREQQRTPTTTTTTITTISSSTTTSSSGHVLPTTPVSATGASEGAVPVNKDGLGPKIWTGTHFLPRFVRAAEVPGEGLCYFYDDGSYCKTVIDGEQVNAHWGVTKAGKPRKRLAIACVTCREKKIKCDPDYPRCVQCEKFGRVCKFKNAPRGGHNASPQTPPAEPDELGRPSFPTRPPPSDLPRPGSHSSESVSPRTTIRPASPDLPSAMGMPPIKRMKFSPYESSHHNHLPHSHQHHHYPPPPPMSMPPASSTSTSGPSPHSPMMPTPDTARSATFSWHHVHPHQHQQQPEILRHEDGLLHRPWQTEPRPDTRL